MRFYEIKGGIRVPLSIEERQLVDTIEKANTVDAEDLDLRDAELARKLASRGVLNKIETEDSTHYTVNKLEDLWRD